MREDAYRCDMCGIMRTPSNHWWLIKIDAKGFSLSEWDTKKAKLKTIKHLCGQGCVHKTVDKFFSPSAPVLVKSLEADEVENLARVAFPS